MTLSLLWKCFIGEFSIVKVLCFKVLWCYRPEDTHRGRSAAMEADLNLLYWGGGETQVMASQVHGKCEVWFGEDIEGEKDEWFMMKTDRFYFFEAYDSASKSFVDPPTAARGLKNKGKVGLYCIGLYVTMSAQHVGKRERKRERQEVYFY